MGNFTLVGYERQDSTEGVVIGSQITGCSKEEAINRARIKIDADQLRGTFAQFLLFEQLVVWDSTAESAASESRVSGDFLNSSLGPIPRDDRTETLPR